MDLSKNENNNSECSSLGKCKVCNNDATGVHYGVLACDECKVIIINYTLFKLF